MRYKFTYIFLTLWSLTALASFPDKAVWIGTSGESLPLHAPTLPVFRIDCDFTLGSGSLSLLYGVNDERLMNPNLNIYNMYSEPGQSYIKFTFEADSLSIYRAGYHPSDTPENPIAIFKALNLDAGSNHLRICSNLGHTDIYINGRKTGYVGLNPAGNGGDFTAFPVVGDLSVEISGDNSGISNLSISNYREPSSTLAIIDGPITTSTDIRLPRRSMPALRTSFVTPGGKTVSDAQLTATARGIYDIRLNGERITDEYFLPGCTQYNKTHLYHTFDVTEHVRYGVNDLRVDLGEGWWSGGATFAGENWNFYGDRQSFISELIIRYTDGSVDTIASSPATWQVSTSGPLITGSFFQGEIFDATLSDIPDSEWRPASEVHLAGSVAPLPGGWDKIDFRPSFGDHVSAFDTLVAQSVAEPRPGVYIYDMGQNIAGLPQIDVIRLQRGDTLYLRYAEVLYPDMPAYYPNAGMIMTENLRAAGNRDIYIAAGKPDESFSPRFTLHGFRYIEITGPEDPLPIEAVKALSISSIHNLTAHFECSDSLVNRLWENICRSTLSNFISIPTDCPQRNERLGWMGDISVYAPTAVKLADISPLLKQYLQSIRDCQEPDGRFPDVAPTGFGFGGLLWGSAGITVPWELFKETADTAMLRQHYPAMVRYIDYILRETIDDSSGLIVQNRAWGDLGDWLSPEYDSTDKSLLWECYFIHDLKIMSEIARILGHTDDQSRYSSLSEIRTDYFKATYIHPTTGKTIRSAFEPDKAGRQIDTQVSYALPIVLIGIDNANFINNFIHTVERENMADNGRICPPYSLMTGFIGTAWISEALSRVGRSDIAYKMLLNKSYPSWLYPVTQGATTVWERLDSYTHTDGFGENNRMNSFNHYSFGSVANWLLERVLGINYRSGETLLIRPEPDQSGALKYAGGWIETPAGRVESSWHTGDGAISFDITIPVGTTATFIHPVSGHRQTLGPGTHHIE